jgi:hypothetical protein
MRWVGLVVTVAVLLAVAAVLWLQIIYGTVDPCRALAAEMQRDTARRAGIPAYVVEQSPRDHNASPAVIAARVDGLSAGECIGRLFGELLAGTPPRQT